MLFPALATSLLLSLSVSANPLVERREVYPEVIPGEGLPSLASLGLTSAELYETPVPPTGDMSVQIQTTCGPDPAYAPVNDIIACYNFLNSLGDQACKVQRGFLIPFCTAGNGKVTGQTGGDGHDESSKCSDVARGLLFVIDGCTRGDKTVAGYQTAWGNGNILVRAMNKNYR